MGGYPPSYRVAKWGLSPLLTHPQLSHPNLPGLTHECWGLVLGDITQLSYLPRLCHLRLLCDTSLLLSLPPWFFFTLFRIKFLYSYFSLSPLRTHTEATCSLPSYLGIHSSAFDHPFPHLLLPLGYYLCVMCRDREQNDVQKGDVVCPRSRS